ncbi:MAG: hypothetical protein PHR16_16905 [Methylovulum sp.]|nr:hypothetical protein [Methylovulum sp.]
MIIVCAAIILNPVGWVAVFNEVALITSPDIIDAMSFAWLEDAVYIPADNLAGSGTLADAVRKAENAFADVDWVIRIGDYHDYMPIF